MSRETLILSDQDVAALLPHEEVIGMVDTVFQEWGRGQVVMPPKVNLDMSRSGHPSWANAMPAYMVTDNVGGLKWVGGYGDNPARGLPYIMGIVVLTDPETGHALALMDGNYISDWRTGASAAIAAKHLAREGTAKIDMIGAGAQGRTATVCLHAVFPQAALVVADLSAPRREAFCRDLRDQYGVPVAEAPMVQAAADGADVVVLLTTAQEPFLKADWIGAGCLTLAMGSYQQAEDQLILGADKIIVDCWGQAEHRGELKPLVEAGRLSAADVAAELGFVAAGVKPGRTGPEERLLAVLVGLGAHDVYIAGQVYRRALAAGRGHRVCLRHE
ncbi:MAG: ornithine cyclodeaminase family protein [Armatimonadetes bacterium]|nr:ornithine cyclodeaminase family protein [Armatimonadota bacterium]